jgi:hypothetical protein
MLPVKFVWVTAVTWKETVISIKNYQYYTDKIESKDSINCSFKIWIIMISWVWPSGKWLNYSLLTIQKLRWYSRSNVTSYLAHTKTNKQTWIVPKRSSRSSTARSTCIKISLKAKINKNEIEYTIKE